MSDTELASFSIKIQYKGNIKVLDSYNFLINWLKQNFDPGFKDLSFNKLKISEDSFECELDKDNTIYFDPDFGNKFKIKINMKCSIKKNEISIELKEYKLILECQKDCDRFKDFYKNIPFIKSLIENMANSIFVLLKELGKINNFSFSERLLNNN